ncbi:taste receptor type 1 member 1-like [Centropristis striata]|uniref:taste receptor type 1 member 1-like n=1 Tax=Centropristis striata TaxID=184440 RepID=UPI0027DF0522|nr:taste receptor type 1 member 1-like [Centropristis striata]
MRMKHFLLSLCVLGAFLHVLAQCTAPASEFHLEGDYLLGGLFDIHHDSTPVDHERPEAIDCSSKPFILSSYRRFQVMRFSVEEINNSTNLLPNVSLGYEIFDHCSDTHSFPNTFSLISVDGLIQPWSEPQKNLSKVMAVVGTYTSPMALTVAPLLVMNLIPMVSYGAASSVFSRKRNFPSFLRTVHPNKDVIEVIFNILQHFNWRWVAFLNIDDDYGIDGQDLFIKRIKDTEICLAYTKSLNQYTEYSQVFKQIEAHKIGIIIVFAPEWTAEALIESAIQLNVTNKVWIAGDAWSLNKRLPKKKGIKNVGTILGVSEPAMTIPNFNEFVYSSKSQTHCENTGQQELCNQVCNCSGLSAEDIIAADPSFNFPVYSAVYAIAHALHNALQCGSGRCDGTRTVYPEMVLAELKTSNFTLLNQSIRFDKNGDPNYGSYSIVFWNHSGDAEEIGFYHFYRSLPVHFFIDNNKIQWHTKGEAPTALCSEECPVGHAKKQDGIHKCCFNCIICPNGTYVNNTEFQLEGDYLLGGLFDIHHDMETFHQTFDRPEAIDCSSQTFILSSYRRFQLMRFSVEEINNSTILLPNVSLGYNIFDHCSETHNFPDVLELISVNNVIQPWDEPNKNLSKVSKIMAVVGPFSSTDTLTLAPLFMTDLIPMVSYGAASSAFAEKAKYPSFLRTVHSNKDVIEAIVKIILHFKWRWVAFLNSDDAFGKDGLDLFIKRIEDTEICLAYTKHLGTTDDSLMFKNMESLKIHVVIVFAPKIMAEALIEAAVRLNVTNKVWIAGDTWSLSNRFNKEEVIKNIGTVLGVSQPVLEIPGFSDFIYSFKSQTHCENTGQQEFCNQVCNCSSLSAEEILAVDSSYSFPVYSAVYAIAHALHNALECGVDKCNGNITMYPYMVLAELKKSNFTLLNQSIQFNENGDLNYGSYSIVSWNHSGDAEEIGFYKLNPSVNFYINNTKIQWYTNGEVPTSLCSNECPVGYAKKQDGIHKCCFNCNICPNGTYINSTEDPSMCIACKQTEWSTEGSTSCNLRVVEYIPFTDGGAIVIMVGALVLVSLTLAMSALFAINYNTPVVRSAGGPMCFLILGCLSLCSLSVFFHFGKPTISFCILRFLPFLLFYTVCLACFVVRSFQIVCIFKMAAKFPKLHSWWVKYHGQWLVITVAFATQALLLLIGYICAPPKPYNDTFWYPDKIILGCAIDLKVFSGPGVLLLFFCSLCFIFSYMGKDLPKNYNEAKAITFCLLLLIFTWIIFATEYVLYHGKYIQTLNALAVLSSLYSFLLWYFIPKCYIIIFEPHKNTQEYFQGLIQSYTKTISQ